MAAQRARNGPVPLDLITGFLGSGKTTFINRLLRNPAFAGAMVIVNEFGEIGLDHLLMSTAQDNVLLLESGCMCCAASGSLRDTLIDLFSRRATGDVPAFDRLIVETSGLAHPGPIVASLIGDSALMTRCNLAQVTTLVDCVNGVATLEKYLEAQRQLAFAEVVLLTKADMATPEQIERTRARVQALNPHAEIQMASEESGLESSAAAVVATAAAFGSAMTSARNAGTPQWIRGPIRPQYKSDASGETHGDSFGVITTHSVQINHAVEWSDYAAWSDAMRRKLGARLLRGKGVLTIGEEGKRWVVQSVQGYFAPPAPLPSDISSGDFIVCIGESLKREEIAGIFRLLDGTHRSNHIKTSEQKE